VHVPSASQDFHLSADFLLQCGAHSFRRALLALMRIAREQALIIRQFHQKFESPDAIGADSLGIDDDRAIHQLPKVIPVELAPVREFLRQARRIESVSSLPQLQNDKATDEGSIERTFGEHTKVINVACFVALIACTDFLCQAEQGR